MKTVTRQVLTFSIWIGMLAGSQLLAQQTNLDKRPARITPSKTIYVAQQRETTDTPADTSTSPQSTDNSTSPQSSQNSTSKPVATSQTQTSDAVPSDAVPGTIFPGVVPADQAPGVVAEDMMGVDNGLWEGCETGNCCAVCGGGYCSPPLWYTEQGARILSHSSPPRAGISYRFGLNAAQTAQAWLEVANTHSANFNVAPGYNATIGRYLGRDALDRDDFLEFTYWGMNTWFTSIDFNPGTGQVSETDIGNIAYLSGRLNTQFIARVPTDVINPQSTLGAVGFDSTEGHNWSMDSEMHNWELNVRLRPRGRPDQLVLQPNGRWRRECQPGRFFSYLVGLRYMTVGEGFHFHSAGGIQRYDISDPNNPIFIDTKNVSGDYNIITQNDLLGLQIGADLMFRRCKWSWGVRSKLGLCINFASDVKDIVNDTQGLPTLATFNDRFSQRQQSAAMIGEVGFEVTYKFKPNLKGRAAYDFMWINGLALGAEQLTWSLDPGANDTISTSGNIYSHGVSLGLEWCW